MSQTGHVKGELYLRALSNDGAFKNVSAEGLRSLAEIGLIHLEKRLIDALAVPEIQRAKWDQLLRDARRATKLLYAEIDRRESLVIQRQQATLSVLFLSTAYVPSAIPDWGNMEVIVTARGWILGWVVESRNGLVMSGSAPDWLIPILDYMEEHGFDLVIFDEEGPDVDDLTRYSWTEEDGSDGRPRRAIYNVADSTIDKIRNHLRTDCSIEDFVNVIGNIVFHSGFDPETGAYDPDYQVSGSDFFDAVRRELLLLGLQFG